MMNPPGGPGDKFIGFFRLVDAYDRPGCPVCRDPDTRKRLYSSWGFCSWHAWMLPKTPDPAFGSSIIYADLLRLAIERLDIAYGRSQGLCVPHAIRALELGAGSPRADQLIARTLSKWAELPRDLSGFVAKHDYRNIEPFTEAEGTAYLRAFEALVGASGVFGNDAHRGQRADNEESRRTIARLRAEIARLRAELEGVRSAHE
jgi:hypothetical protein